MLLRYFDRAGIEAELDERTGDLRLRPTADFPCLLREAEGVFTFFGAVAVILETTSAGVFLRVGPRFDSLNDVGVEVSGDEGSRTLEITWSTGDVDRFDYTVTGWIDNDPTPSIAREDFDFGLFLRNVRSDPARQRRMRGVSDD